MNHFLRENKDDFMRWCKHIVPYALTDLRNFDYGMRILLHHDDYEYDLKVKRQLYVLSALLDENHRDYLYDTLLDSNDYHGLSLVERELYNDIYEVWRAVCFPNGRSSIETISPVLLGGELKAERMIKGIPAKHAAELVGIAEKTLYCYEEGTRIMRIDTFYKLCQIYKARPEDIIERSTEHYYPTYKREKYPL
ncbi:helix-turn-helix transcriptional regulator [Candidatus Saccharibacteria bacterium]|nr:helix-turn-helix transcriptional regulator [Candidatus Saccharibacteria bacterium]